METILGWLFIIVLFVGFHILKATVFAAGRAAIKGGGLKDNFNVAMNGMSQLEMRIVDVPANHATETPAFQKIEIKGLLPNKHRMKVGFLTSVIDVTTEEKLPVCSLIEDFQESKSMAYQHRVVVGDMDSGMGFVSWVKVGVVLPGILQAPYSGKRTVVVFLRMIDLENVPEIHQGFHSGEPEGMLWCSGLRIELEFQDKGWAEAIEHREEAQCLAIKLGVAVAMASGGMDDTEGETIKLWIERMLSGVSAANRERLKPVFNDAFRTAYEEAKSGNLKLSSIAERLETIADKRIKYAVIDLCMDVMAADGKVDREELRIINAVADALKLDLKEIEKMRDQRMVRVDVSETSENSIEEVLGIRQDWDTDRVNRYLRDEFQKWNNRLTSLPEGPERENAQKMLELIANARKKSA